MWRERHCYWIHCFCSSLFFYSLKWISSWKRNKNFLKGSLRLCCGTEEGNIPLSQFLQDKPWILDLNNEPQWFPSDYSLVSPMSTMQGSKVDPLYWPSLDRVKNGQKGLCDSITKHWNTENINVMWWVTYIHWCSRKV